MVDVPILQDKNVVPTMETQEIVADDGYTGLSKVTVEKITGDTLEVTPGTEQQNFSGVYIDVKVAGDENLVAENIKKDVEIFGVKGEMEAGFDTSSIMNAERMFMYNRTMEEAPYLNAINIIRANSMFYTCTNLKKVPCYEFSNAEYMDSMFAHCDNLLMVNIKISDKCGTCTQMFYSCDGTEEINIFGTTSNVKNMYGMFNGCKSLKKLSALDADSANSTDGVFKNCTALEDFGGLINIGKGYTEQTNNYGSYRYYLNSSPNLTHESLMNVINNLYDLNVTYDVANGGTLYTQTLALNSPLLVKLTAEEIAIATNKGWTVL